MVDGQLGMRMGGIGRCRDTVIELVMAWPCRCGFVLRLGRELEKVAAVRRLVGIMRRWDRGTGKIMVHRTGSSSKDLKEYVSE